MDVRRQKSVYNAENALPADADIILPWHLQLPNNLERAFRTRFLLSCRSSVQSACFFILPLYLFAFIFEYLIDASAISATWRPRLLGLLSIALVYFAARNSWYKQLLQPAIVIMSLTLLVTHLYLGISIEHLLANHYFYISLVSMLLIVSMFPLLFLWALATGTLMFLFVVIAVSVFSPLLSMADATIISGHALVVTVICLTGRYVQERLHRRLFISESILYTHQNELNSANQSLQNEALEDPLTSTVNRRGMERRLFQLMRQVDQNKRDAPDVLSVLLFDVDHFKQYNDYYGHLAGDQCLITIANLARSMVRRNEDFVARFGGEEFVVVLYETALPDGLAFAERLRTRILQQGIEHALAEELKAVTISVGVACANQNPIFTHEEIIRHTINQADMALYAAKNAGRNRVACMDNQSTTPRVL